PCGGWRVALNCSRTPRPFFLLDYFFQPAELRPFLIERAAATAEFTNGRRRPTLRCRGWIFRRTRQRLQSGNDVPFDVAFLPVCTAPKSSVAVIGHRLF